MRVLSSEQQQQQQHHAVEGWTAVQCALQCVDCGHGLRHWRCAALLQRAEKQQQQHEVRQRQQERQEKQEKEKQQHERQQQQQDKQQDCGVAVCWDGAVQAVLRVPGQLCDSAVTLTDGPTVWLLDTQQCLLWAARHVTHHNDVDNDDVRHWTQAAAHLSCSRITLPAQTPDAADGALIVCAANDNNNNNNNNNHFPADFAELLAPHVSAVQTLQLCDAAAKAADWRFRCLRLAADGELVVEDCNLLPQHPYYASIATAVAKCSALPNLTLVGCGTGMVIGAVAGSLLYCVKYGDSAVTAVEESFTSPEFAVVQFASEPPVVIRADTGEQVVRLQANCFGAVVNNRAFSYQVDDAAGRLVVVHSVDLGSSEASFSGNVARALMRKKMEGAEELAALLRVREEKQRIYEEATKAFSPSESPVVAVEDITQSFEGSQWYLRFRLRALQDGLFGSVFLVCAEGGLNDLVQTQLTCDAPRMQRAESRFERLVCVTLSDSLADEVLASVVVEAGDATAVAGQLAVRRAELWRQRQQRDESVTECAQQSAHNSVARRAEALREALRAELAACAANASNRAVLKTQAAADEAACALLETTTDKLMQ